MNTTESTPEPESPNEYLEEAFAGAWRISDEMLISEPMYTNWALRAEIRRWFLLGARCGQEQEARKTRTESQPQSV